MMRKRRIRVEKSVRLNHVVGGDTINVSSCGSFGFFFPCVIISIDFMGFRCKECVMPPR